MRSAPKPTHTDGPRLIQDVLRDRRGQRGDPGFVSRQDLSNRTHDLGYNVPIASITALEMRPGLVPSMEVLRVLAEALGLDETDFYEWPIASARAGAKKQRAAKEIAAAAARRRSDKKRPSREDLGGTH